MGLSEAVTIPTVQNFVSRYVPEENKSVILGIVLSGLQVGNVAAYLVSPYLLDNYGWSSVLIVYGLIGLLWLGLWIPLAPSAGRVEAGKGVPGSVIAYKDAVLSSNMTSVLGKVIDTTLVTPSDVVYTDTTSTSSVTTTQSTSTAQTDTDAAVSSTSSSAGFDLSALIATSRASLATIPFKEIVSAKEVQAIAVAHAVQVYTTTLQYYTTLLYSICIVLYYTFILYYTTTLLFPICTTISHVYYAILCRISVYISTLPGCRPSFTSGTGSASTTARSRR